MLVENSGIVIIILDAFGEPIVVLVHDLLAHLPLLYEVVIVAFLSVGEGGRLDRVRILNDSRVFLGPFIITIVQRLNHADSGGN